jgi:recombination protein RecA
MVERVTPIVKGKVANGGNYFTRPKNNLAFFSSGCHTLDLALGGGWAENRIANIVGDKSTGKTLLAIEACANFAIKYPKGKIRYRECEASFDKSYASALGMPVERIDFGSDPMDTVEDMYEDLTSIIEKSRQPELYILDSLDALSDRAELARKIDKGSFGASKAKQMSQLFRRLAQKMSNAHVTFIIISQIRDKINATFGRQWERSGGRALDFYASQVLYLAHIEALYQQVSNVKRAVGIKIAAKVDKNKISLPFREARFDISFGYGVDDIAASLDFLKTTKKLQPLLGTRNEEAYLNLLSTDGREVERFRHRVEEVWFEIEQKLVPSQPKYQV